MSDVTYDVSAVETSDGVHVELTMTDAIDDVSAHVDLGTHPDHDTAATVVSSWVRADLDFVDL